MRFLSPQQRSEHNRYQRKYYDNGIKATMVPRGSPYLQRHVDELVRAAALTRDERVIEVGCGMGRYTLILAERGYDVEALDLSPVLLQHLSEFNTAGYPIPLHEADVMSPPDALHGRFDAAIGFFALHHMHELALCFEGMARMVRPGGRIVFVEPNAYNPLYYIQIATTKRMTWAGDKGVAQMRPAVIARAMEQAGLRNPTVERFGFFPPKVANTETGRRLERALERIPFWRWALPFQIFRGERV